MSNKSFAHIPNKVYETLKLCSLFLNLKLQLVMVPTNQTHYNKDRYQKIQTTEPIKTKLTLKLIILYDIQPQNSKGLV